MIDLLISPDILCPIKVIVDGLERLTILNIKNKLTDFKPHMIDSKPYMIDSGVVQ